MPRYVTVRDTTTGENLIVMEDQLTDPKERIIAELVTALRDCAEDLESFVEAHYPPAVRAYPSELRRYERDIASAKAARAECRS